MTMVGRGWGEQLQWESKYKDIYLPVKYDTPNKTKCELWIAIHNIVCWDVDKFNLGYLHTVRLVKQKGEGEGEEGGTTTTTTEKGTITWHFSLSTCRARATLFRWWTRKRPRSNFYTNWEKK